MTESVSFAGARIHAGRFYKLLHQVGPIPAGIYRSEGCADNEFHFSVGDDRTIRFSLENLDSTTISQVSFSLGRARAMQREEFISSYFSLPTSYHMHPYACLDAPAPRLLACVISFVKQPLRAATFEALANAPSPNVLTAN